MWVSVAPDAGPGERLGPRAGGPGQGHGPRVSTGLTRGLCSPSVAHPAAVQAVSG